MIDVACMHSFASCVLVAGLPFWYQKPIMNQLLYSEFITQEEADQVIHSNWETSQALILLINSFRN